jgi:hypothetical protein
VNVWSKTPHIPTFLHTLLIVSLKYINIAMKATKTMLIAIGTMLLTYTLLGLLIYVLSSTVSYREVLVHPAYGVFMLIVGWVPSAIVSVDYYESY